MTGIYNTDQPAFPLEFPQQECPGLTKREYMAAHLMAAILTTCKSDSPDAVPEMLACGAQIAVQAADALLAALATPA